MVDNGASGNLIRRLLLDVTDAISPIRTSLFELLVIDESIGFKIFSTLDARIVPVCWRIRLDAFR